MSKSFRVDIALPIAQRKIREAVAAGGSILSLEEALKYAREAFPGKSRADVLAALIRKHPMFRRIA